MMKNRREKALSSNENDNNCSVAKSQQLNKMRASGLRIENFEHNEGLFGRTAE